MSCHNTFVPIFTVFIPVLHHAIDRECPLLFSLAPLPLTLLAILVSLLSGPFFLLSNALFISSRNTLHIINAPYFVLSNITPNATKKVILTSSALSNKQKKIESKDLDRIALELSTCHLFDTPVPNISAFNELDRRFI